MSKDKLPASVPSKIRERLYQKLQDPAFASSYVNEALLEGDEVVFKTAVGDVIRARGVVKIAKRAGINRSTVFKTLKPETRTSFTTFHSLLRACDIKFSTQPVLNIKSEKVGKKAIRR
jgi:probable addiction module antidote protein